jgi:hypothetical protein
MLSQPCASDWRRSARSSSAFSLVRCESRDYVPQSSSKSHLDELSRPIGHFGKKELRPITCWLTRHTQYWTACESRPTRAVGPRRTQIICTMGNERHTGGHIPKIDATARGGHMSVGPLAPEKETSVNKRIPRGNYGAHKCNLARISVGARKLLRCKIRKLAPPLRIETCRPR